MVYRADRYKDMLDRRENELMADCECGCNGAFENIIIGLLLGFIIGIGVVVL